MSLWSNRKPALGQRSTSKKWATFMRSKPEPAIWSRDSGQWISWYESCQLNITWMSNIKDICCNPRLHDLVLARWPPCCVMLSSLCDIVVVGCTHPWYMPLAIFTMRKELHGFLYFYACMRSCSYSYGAPLGGPSGPWCCAKICWLQFRTFLHNIIILFDFIAFYTLIFVYIYRSQQTNSTVKLDSAMNYINNNNSY